MIILKIRTYEVRRLNQKLRTNAMRLLDAAGIEYTTIEYEVDDNDLSGQSVAAKIHMPAEQVFKTLVLRGDKRGIIVCCIPVVAELNLKALAIAAQDKKVDMLAVKELLPITGYIRGGCSPIGMKKRFPTFIDETIILYDKVAISAGVRGCQIIISPQELIDYTQSILCDVSVV